MVQRLEHRRALAQDTVGAEDCPLLLQEDHEVVGGVAGRVQDPAVGSGHRQHGSVMDLLQLNLASVLRSGIFVDRDGVVQHPKDVRDSPDVVVVPVCDQNVLHRHLK